MPIEDKIILSLEEINKALQELSKSIDQPQVVSVSAEILLSLVPIIGIVFGGLVIFFYLLWQYRLKKKLIEAKLYENYFIKYLKPMMLLMGCLCTFIGLPLTFIIFFIEGASYSLLGGIIPFFTGVSFILAFVLSKKYSLF